MHEGNKMSDSKGTLPSVQHKDDDLDGYSIIFLPNKKKLVGFR